MPAESKDDVRLSIDNIKEIVTPNNPIDNEGRAIAGRKNKGKRAVILILKDVKG